MDENRNRRWNSLLRIGGFLAAVGGMYISAQFSVDGFAFSVDSRKWLGWAMAIIIIIIQSVWQKFGGNRTLFVIAIICYVYGVFTNVVGMMENREAEDWSKWIIPIVFGIFLEVFPEPLLAWSISGDTTSDPLGKLWDGIENGGQSKQKPQFKPGFGQTSFQPPKTSYQPRFKTLGERRNDKPRNPRNN